MNLDGGHGTKALRRAAHGADADRLAAAVGSILSRTPDGSYVITSHAGCLICEV